MTVPKIAWVIQETDCPQEQFQAGCWQQLPSQQFVGSCMVFLYRLQIAVSYSSWLSRKISWCAWGLGCLLHRVLGACSVVCLWNAGQAVTSWGIEFSPLLQHTLFYTISSINCSILIFKMISFFLHQEARRMNYFLLCQCILLLQQVLSLTCGLAWACAPFLCPPVAHRWFLRWRIHHKYKR